MEVDAAGKDGNKGQSKGGKEKSKHPKSDECYICGRRGHGQKDCWYKDTKGNKGQGKFTGNGKQKGKGKDMNNPVTEVRQDEFEQQPDSSQFHHRLDLRKCLQST